MWEWVILRFIWLIWVIILHFEYIWRHKYSDAYDYLKRNLIKINKKERRSKSFSTSSELDKDTSEYLEFKNKDMFIDKKAF